MPNTSASALIDFSEIIKRIVKYLIEGFMVALVATLVPRRSLDWDDIVIISLTAGTTFSILDTYVPSVGASMRDGAGLGLGLRLIGF